MKTNDIKKGMRIIMTNGWQGTMMDNMRGNIRVAEIEGTYTETGSVYAFDIAMAQPLNDGIWHKIELTEKQLDSKKMNEAIFG